MEVVGQRSEMTWVVCDEILLVWKMNSEKHAGNQDKCAGLEIKDQELLVMVLMGLVIVKAMPNKNAKVAVLSWEVGIWNEGVGGGSDDGV